MERGIEIFFKQQIEVKIVTLPEGSDPCDYLVAHGGEAFQTLVDDGEAALAFKWRHMQEKFTSSDSVATRKAATDAFLLLVTKACSGGKLDNIYDLFTLMNAEKSEWHLADTRYVFE